MILYLYINIINNKKVLKLIHSVMKKEVVTLAKSVFVVVVGVLLANALERKYLKSKVDAPMVATTK